MGGYGYTYRSFSAYSTVKDESSGPAIRPLAPFVPKINRSSEGYVTKKTIVPVASRPYGDDYPARDDRQTSPVHGRPPKSDEFFTKVQNEASRPDWRQPSQPSAYNGAGGYGDYGNYGNKERRKPIGSTIRNDNSNGYNGANGYGDYGDYSNKEGRKPTRNDDYDGYKSPKGYGDYGNYSNKEGRKPTWNDDYAGYNSPKGYGNYSNKEERKPTRNDDYDGYNSTKGYDDYGNYSNREGQRPIGSTTRDDDYYGCNSPKGYGDYGNYSNKEGHKPTGSPTRNDNYDGNGYGNYNNREGQKPIASTIRKPAENYGAVEPNKVIPTSRPQISSGWTASPRKGTPLSEPTNDIGTAMELLKEAAKLKPSGHSPGSGSRLGEPTSKVEKDMELLKEAERLRNIATGRPQPRSTLPIEPATPSKDHFGETIDSRDAARGYGNFNLSSRPRTPPTQRTTIVVAPDYKDNIEYRDTARRYGKASLPGSTIDSRAAEKKYKGKRI